MAQMDEHEMDMSTHSRRLVPDLDDNLPPMEHEPSETTEQYNGPYENQTMQVQTHVDDYSQQVQNVQDLVDAHAKEQEYFQQNLQAQNAQMAAQSRRLVPQLEPNEQSNSLQQHSQQERFLPPPPPAQSYQPDLGIDSQDSENVDEQDHFSEQHTFRPEINRNIPVEASGDLLERLQKWEDMKNKKREDKVRQKAQQEMTEYKGQPLIDEHSARMAERINGRTSQSVSERLYADAERERYHRAVLQEKALIENVPGAPAITKQAAQLLRVGEVTDRLYGQALELAKKRQKAIEAHARKQLEDTRMVHQGATATDPGVAMDGIERGEALYRRAEEDRERKEQEAAKRAEKDRQV
jgi:hypothetical protein